MYYMTPTADKICSRPSMCEDNMTVYWSAISLSSETVMLEFHVFLTQRAYITMILFQRCSVLYQ